MRWIAGIIIGSLFTYALAMDNNQTQETNESAPSFYWVDGEKPSAQLVTLLRAVRKDGTILCKERLQVGRVEEALQALHQEPTLAHKERLEQEATRLLKRYVKLSNNGCYGPERFLEEETYAQPRKKNYNKIITNPILQNLKKAFEKYRALKQQGGWERIEVGDVAYIRPGKEYAVIPAIKARLQAEGYYHGVVDENRSYTQELREAVVDFQLHHGLKPDGVIGPATLEAMNQSVDDKLKKILLNIERLRWFLQDDAYFVFVNIPGYFLQVYDHGAATFESKVIVGRKKRPTPLMRDEIAYAVLNPYWRAPKTIIKEDILPYLKRGDFEHLKKVGIIVTKDYLGKKPVKVEEINWSQYSDEDVEDLPFFFLQTTGPHNFLGYLKLIFPNEFDVYLHDTNHPQLFRYTYRALSSGCVRVQKPIELFHLLKSKESELTYRKIFDIIWKQKTKKIYFKERVPIYLGYLTAFMDENGEVYFYNDVYGYDRRMWKIFKKFKDFDRFVLEAK